MVSDGYWNSSQLVRISNSEIEETGRETTLAGRGTQPPNCVFTTQSPELNHMAPPCCKQAGKGLANTWAFFVEEKAENGCLRPVDGIIIP